jgi:hypothetical protein
MGLKNWLRNRAAGLMIALSNVEKQSLTQSDEGKGKTNVMQRLNGNSLGADLSQGKLTQQVVETRARYYKVLQESEKYRYRLKMDNKWGELTEEEYEKCDVEVPENTEFNTQTTNDKDDSYYYDSSIGVINKIDVDKARKNIVVDSIDSYEIEMSINNDEYYDENEVREHKILIERDFRPRFQIENFSKKLNVRKIDGKSKLLEFYISKYPNVDDKKTTLLLKEIERAIVNPRSSEMLEFKTVGFISYKDNAVSNYLEFQYEIKSFDKIISHEGHYVIKFIALEKISNVNMFDKYANAELDKKYENKEKRNND